MDTYNTTADGGAVTSWHKPRLARTGDVQYEEVFDPDDHMADGYVHVYIYICIYMCILCCVSLPLSLTK